VRAYPNLWRPDPAQVGAQLAAGRVRYLVDLPCPQSGTWQAAGEAWRQWLAAHRDALTLLYSDRSGHIRVWRVGGTVA
jgi:hypothetical protein